MPTNHKVRPGKIYMQVHGVLAVVEEQLSESGGAYGTFAQEWPL